MLGQPSLMDPLLWTRAGSLAFLVVAFQVLVARVSLKKETKRRLQHALTGHALVQISYVLPREICFALLVLGAAGIYIIHQFYPSKFQQAFGALLRPHELHQLPGAFWFLVGTAITVLLMKNETIIRYAVECLALADPMASWIGSTIRSPKINSGSSVSGCVACFATAVAVGKVMLTNPSNYTLGIGALACTIAEASPYGNDNLNIPILTALAVYHFGGYSSSWFNIF
jgi:dolichol kinase